MALSCRELLELLGEYRDRSLDGETHVAAEAHLLECEECVAYLRSYEETIRLSKSAFARRHDTVSQEPPEDLVDAIMRSARRAKHRVPH
jgi:predicted anti-sigma-YlaC factor YlaD